MFFIDWRHEYRIYPEDRRQRDIIDAEDITTLKGSKRVGTILAYEIDTPLLDYCLVVNISIRYYLMSARGTFKSGQINNRYRPIISPTPARFICPVHYWHLHTCNKCPPSPPPLPPPPLPPLPPRRRHRLRPPYYLILPFSFFSSSSSSFSCRPSNPLPVLRDLNNIYCGRCKYLPSRWNPREYFKHKQQIYWITWANSTT